MEEMEEENSYSKFIEEIHQKLIYNNKEYLNIVNKIIEGDLMYKLEIIDNKPSIRGGYSKSVDTLINNWYKMAKNIYIPINEDIILYRGFGPITQNYLIHPLPFSTTYNKNRSVEYGTGNILEIKIPIKTIFTYLNPGEEEVLLPAGVIIMLGITEQFTFDSKNYIIHKCTFEPTESYDDMYDLWNRYDIKNYGYNSKLV